MFSNFQEGFLLIFPKQSLLTMTQSLVPKSQYVWKMVGDESVDQNKHLYKSTLTNTNYMVTNVTNCVYM